MKTKKVEFGLLVFALTTIMWCVIFAYVIGKINDDYKQLLNNINYETRTSNN